MGKLPAVCYGTGDTVGGYTGPGGGAYTGPGGGAYTGPGGGAYSGPGGLATPVPVAAVTINGTDPLPPAKSRDGFPSPRIPFN